VINNLTIIVLGIVFLYIYMVYAKLKYSHIESFIPQKLIEHLRPNVDYTFITTDNINSLEIHDGVTEIGLQEFRFGCCKRDKQRIKTIKIPTSVTKIGDYAFDHNDLTEVDIPDSVQTIGT